ncbi:ABC transporter ATP-binding protein [Clostridium niameyense]|uniref:ABC transporter ATP-binding protein n=1 Tax=Clostridium niameyense TaxID=1622073 RepID=A0A6M0R882_9CLOT|nr:ABC transporter ATP-binding protein [Clostridium niameyense]NEZ46424.1 ABC transporter ATP-binding protein [Clostridium niameyense]
MKDSVYTVQIINGYKNYEKQKVFEGLNIDFIENHITGILGPSGCGKTTLLNIISGIESLDKGNLITRCKNISYIFQEDILIPWLTVHENIAFVLKSYMNKKEIDERVYKYLNLVKLKEHKDKFPRELSGGMKRRVAIARAFCHKSSLILMDEPFKGLDINLKNEIIKELKQILKYDNRTGILVTHDINEAKALAHETYYFKDGSHLIEV